MKDYLFTESMMTLVGASPTGTPPGPAASSSWRPPTPSPPWTSGTRPSSTRSRSEHGNLVCFQHCSDPGAAGVRHLPQVAQVLLLHVSRAAARHARRHPPRAAPRPDRHREAPRRGGGQVHCRARAARGARAGHHPHLPGHPRLHPGDQVHAYTEIPIRTVLRRRRCSCSRVQGANTWTSTSGTWPLNLHLVRLRHPSPTTK